MRNFSGISLEWLIYNHLLSIQIPRIALENVLTFTTEIPKNPKEVRLRRVKYPLLKITQLISKMETEKVEGEGWELDRVCP